MLESELRDSVLKSAGYLRICWVVSNHSMIKGKKILKGLIIILSLFAFQTLTYFTIGQRLLKNKLLPDYFATITHRSDSVFVRDFYITSCSTGDPSIHSSPNLSTDEKLIKEKFAVSYVHFDSPENFSWNDTTERKFNLIYNTWSDRNDWLTLFGLYSARQTETLLTDNEYFYKREATYRWLFFFWVPTFEWFESSNICND